MNKLRILAGQTAFDHIRQHGLQQSDVSAIFGASGAAKWLAIYGLDRAIFSEWLTDIDHPIDVFGTSIGAFKLAAACRRDAAAALDNLATAYIEQSYPHGITADYIDKETKKILDLVLGGGGSEEILSHPQFRYHCGTVLARGLLGFRCQGQWCSAGIGPVCDALRPAVTAKSARRGSGLGVYPGDYVRC